MDQSDGALIERMAEAEWNVTALIRWDVFFTQYPQKKQPYIDRMRAALDACRKHNGG